MGSLTVALQNAAGAQRTFDRALQTIQANVANASTPGWAKQRLTIASQPFNPNAGYPGGILPGALQDSRARYAEGAVRDRQGTLNYSEQQKSDLLRIQASFDFNSQHSIPNTITSFFNSFSKLSVNPNDKISRQNVINSAQDVSQSINDAAKDISVSQSQVDQQINSVLDSINSRIQKLRDINVQRRSSPNAQNDAGINAQMYSTLEELSQYASVQPLFQPDGTVSVYLSGRTPLLVGDRQWQISSNPSASQAALLDAQGNDITAQVQDGKLGALLDTRNQLLPGYVAQLNTLARNFADQVNQVQRGGLTPAGTPPTGDIFSYNSALGEAYTLTVTALNVDDIAAALPTAPGGNGNALNFAALNTAKTINGLSFSEYFGTLSAKFGRDLNSATNAVDSGQQLLSQARSYRDELSGVNLDESAAELVQYQRAYQASAELFRVLNQLTQTALDLLR